MSENENETGISDGVVSASDGGHTLRQPPKLRLMLDIESLGTTPRSVITEIALVDIDDPQRVWFHSHLDIDAQLALCRTVDGSTIRWWMEQEACDPIPKEQLVLPADLFDYLAEWRRGFSGNGVGSSVEYWCKGASFDFPMLQDLYAQLGGKEEQLWHFGRLRCFRTVARREDPTRQSEPEFLGRRHCALADARHQAAWLRKLEWKREVTCE